MKTYDETIDSVLKRRDAYEAERQKRNKRIKRIALPLTCSFAVILAAAGVWRSGILSKKPPIIPAATTVAVAETKPAAGIYAPPRESANYETTAPTPSEQQHSETTKRQIVDASTEQPVSAQAGTSETYGGPLDGSVSGGATGSVFIPALPQNREIVATGERITDEEAAAYFAQHSASIVSALSASGVPADNLRIAEKGYCHVAYDGTENERLAVRENCRDYLVYNGDTLAAIITLYKENGVLSDTPMFGAAWFEPYHVFLQEHKGEELVYIYAGQTEIILTPYGSMYAPLGSDPTKYMEGIEDPYRLFYHPSDVFVP